jgi:predicted lactoylglutathione lyase
VVSRQKYQKAARIIIKRKQKHRIFTKTSITNQKPRQSNLLTLCKQNHNTTDILFTNSKTTAGSPMQKNWRHRHRKAIFFIKNIIFLAGHTII